MNRIKWSGPAGVVLNQMHTEWCISDTHISRQSIRLDAGAKGVIERVPQHIIFFNNTNMMLEHHVVLGKKLCYIGCKILCFGRTASGESFTGGYIGRRSHVCRAGQPIWFEQLRLEGGGKAMTGAMCLGGGAICAMLVAARDGLPAGTMEATRSSLDTIAAGRYSGVSQFNSFLVAYYVGTSTETARRMMVHCWDLLWPEMLARKSTAASN